jgi:2-methylisocitrate lyase-like PEP mutase family enzyme
MSDPDPAARRRRFRELHATSGGFILPNPWDLGSARLLEALGFEALATTSQGAAAALGRRDGELTRDEAIDHARILANATALPLSADLENGFGDAPEAAATTVRAAAEAGLAGCSIEDYGADAGLYDFGQAVDRVRAAAEAIPREDDAPLVLTARCENHLRGNPDLADTIRRLQAYQEAGADVLYAPALLDLEDIAQVLKSIDRPLNVLLLPGGPSAAKLRGMGVQRISVGSALAWAAYAGLADAARELLAGDSHDYYARALANNELFHQAWSAKD